MDYQSALAFFGGTQKALASALGVTQPTVSLWNGVLPESYQFKIQVLTDGKLRVDPHLMRPIPDRRVGERRQQPPKV